LTLLLLLLFTWINKNKKVCGMYVCMSLSIFKHYLLFNSQFFVEPRT
jgi:hypothetical protein